MLTLPEIRAGLACGLRLMWLDAKSFEFFPADWRVALRSYWLLVVLLPLGIAMTWYVHVPYYEKYNVNPITFTLARGLADALLVPLALGLQYAFAKSQDVLKPFPAYVATMNWLGAATFIVLLLPWWLTTASWLPDASRTNIAIIMYFLGLFYGWFAAWRILKTNPFVAVGFPLIADMLHTLTADSINHALFGVARPFFDQ